MIPIKPRLTGGACNAPPPSRIFAIAQKRTGVSTWNMAGLIQQFDIVCVFIFEIWLISFLDMADFVTWLHATFGRNLAEIRKSVEDAFFKRKYKWKAPNDVKWYLYKWRSRFFEILFRNIIILLFHLNLENRRLFFKSIFFKMNSKFQNFQNFHQTERFVIQLLVVYLCNKFQVDRSIFNPQMRYFCLQNHTNLCRHFFKCDFF